MATYRGSCHCGRVTFNQLGLTPGAMARLRHVLWRAKALPEAAPAPPDDLVAPKWGDPDRLQRLCDMVGSFAPLAIVDAGPDEDGALAIRLHDGKGRPLIIRIAFDSQERVCLLSWSRPVPDGVTIRRAGEADIAALAALERDCPIEVSDGRSYRIFRPHLGQLLRLQGGIEIRVAERQGRFVAMRGFAHRTVPVGDVPKRFGLSQFAVVRPEERGHNLLQCFFRYDQEELGDELFFVHLDEGNAAVLGAFRGGQHLDWKRRVRNLLFTCDASAASFGRHATPADAARIAALLNAAHSGKAMYAEATAASVAERLERVPEAYGWRQVLLGDHAAVGVWLSGEETEDRGPAGVVHRRLATVLDYGFEGAAGLAEVVRLIAAWRAWAAAVGVTHLSLYTSSETPEHAALAPLAASDDGLIFRTPWPEPSAETCRGLYTDALFI